MLGLLLSLENKLHICLQLLCGFFLAPAGFVTHKAVWRDASVPLPALQGACFPTQTPAFSLLLGRAGTSPSGSEAQPLKPAKFPASRRGAGLHAPCCRAA